VREVDSGARHAVVLAGGRGTRLRPYTTTLPKPLVPIGEEFSILEIVLRQLAFRGFRRATLAIGHQGQLIQAVAGDGSQWGLEIDYAPEDEPLGTMGPLVRLLDRLPEHFLVLNGDVLTDIDFADVLSAHVGSGTPITIATYRREVDIDFGVLELDGGRVTGFHEKPQLGYSVSMGVYGLSRSTLADYPSGRPLGFDELVLDLIAAGRHPNAYPFDGYWLDIGRPDDYDRANADFASMRDRLLPRRG
jgi:NDP-sugar pyrophosphorylase family protein